MKSWTSSKTIKTFGLIGVVCAVLFAEGVTGQDFGTGIEVDYTTSIGGIVTALVGIALRFVTVSPVK